MFDSLALTPLSLYSYMRTVVCEDLPLLVNGRIEYLPDTTPPNRDEGTEATHICNPGFILVGNVIRTCQNDSFFDGMMPTCERENNILFYCQLITVVCRQVGYLRVVNILNQVQLVKHRQHVFI